MTQEYTTRSGMFQVVRDTDEQAQLRGERLWHSFECKVDLSYRETQIFVDKGGLLRSWKGINDLTPHISHRIRPSVVVLIPMKLNYLLKMTLVQKQPTLSGNGKCYSGWVLFQAMPWICHNPSLELSQQNFSPTVYAKTFIKDTIKACDTDTHKCAQK